MKLYGNECITTMLGNMGESQKHNDELKKLETRVHTV